MIVIHQYLMNSMAESVAERFAKEMFVHLSNYAPRLLELRGRPCFQDLITAGISRAGDYGFTARGPVRLYIELMISLGCDFDTDPQYPWATSIVRGSTDQMRRADVLQREALTYMNFVMGSRNEHVTSAIRMFRQDFDHLRDQLSSADDIEEIFSLMEILYPQKAAYVGKRQLSVLIGSASKRAYRWGLHSTRIRNIIALLSYAVGHRADRDPLYPWIGQALRHLTQPGESDGYERLLQKTRIYLEGALKLLEVERSSEPENENVR